jgi:hypothetical protein
MKGTIAVDFDGVIHGYSKGWADGSIYDPPIPGVAQALQSLIDNGYEIVIFSTRCDDRVVKGVPQKGQLAEVLAYLAAFGIPYHRVHTGVGKPLCKLFIDDNALRFEGDWGKTLQEALAILE